MTTPCRPCQLGVGLRDDDLHVQPGYPALERLQLVELAEIVDGGDAVEQADRLRELSAARLSAIARIADRPVPPATRITGRTTGRR